MAHQDKTPELGSIPDYAGMTISREDILKDLGKRLEQADRVVDLGNALKQNVYAAGRKCGIHKEEIAKAKLMATVHDLGPDFIAEVDPTNLDKVKK